MRKFSRIAVLVLGATMVMVGQTNNVSVYTIKDFAGVLPTTTPTNPNQLFLYNPEVILADPSGNLYVADTLGHHVWKIDSKGNLTVVIGTGVNAAPTLGKAANTQPIGEPSGLALDAAGNLYVSDRNIDRVFKIDTTGVLTLFAGGTANSRFDGDGRLATQADFVTTRGLAFNPVDGNMYIADTGSERIRKVNMKTGIVTTVAGSGASGGSTTAAFSGDGGPAVLARLSAPQGMAFDSYGNMYVADTGNNRIRMVAIDSATGTIDSGSIITTLAGRPLTAAETATGISAPYTTNTNSALGTCNKPSGGTFGLNCISIGDGGPPSQAILAAPAQLVIDANNNIFVADNNNNRIRELIANPTNGTNQSAGYSQIITVVGGGAAGNAGDGSNAKSATLNHPNGITLDANNNIIFTDLNNNRVRMFSQSMGIIQAVAGFPTFNGDQTALTTTFNNPTGIAVDANGVIYVADSGNNLIRTIDTTGKVTTIAGSINNGDASSEGIPPIQAKLNNPTGITLDPTGTFIYFADTGTNRIRRIAAGQVTTVAGCVFTRATSSSSLAQNCTLTADGLPATMVKLNLSGATTQNTKRFSGVAIGADGTLYFTEGGNQIARKLQADGTLVTIAGQYGIAASGGDGGPAVDLNLSSPEGIAVDKNGYIFIVDKANLTTHMITPNGIAYPIAGQIASSSNDSEAANAAGGVPAAAWDIRFRAIQGATVDNQGNLFLADSSNNRVVRIPYAAPAACVDSSGNLVPSGWPLATAIPQPCTQGNLAYVANRVAGNIGNTGGDFMFDYTAPASSSAAASTVQLSFPTDVAVDSKGNVYFTDCANNMIREAIAPSK